MLPLDIDLVKIIAGHLENIHNGLEEGFLTVTLPEDAPEGTSDAVKVKIMQAQSDILQHLEHAVANAIVALVQQGTVAAAEPNLDNLVVVPNVPIEA